MQKVILLAIVTILSLNSFAQDSVFFKPLVVIPGKGVTMVGHYTDSTKYYTFTIDTTPGQGRGIDSSAFIYDESIGNRFWQRVSGVPKDTLIRYDTIKGHVTMIRSSGAFYVTPATQIEKVTRTWAWVQQPPPPSSNGSVPAIYVSAKLEFIDKTEVISITTISKSKIDLEKWYQFIPLDKVQF